MEALESDYEAGDALLRSKSYGSAMQLYERRIRPIRGPIAGPPKRSSPRSPKTAPPVHRPPSTLRVSRPR